MQKALLMAKRKPDPRQRNGNARRKLRAKVKSWGEPCHICGRPIDYSLPAGNPLSYELDEIMPVAKGGNPLDINNVKPAHRICNQRKSDKLMSELAKAPREELTRALQW